MPPGAVALGDSFIWAEATSGETASRAARRAVEQTRSARIDEILDQEGMIRKSAKRFSEKIMPKQQSKARRRFVQAAPRFRIGRHRSGFWRPVESESTADDGQKRRPPGGGLR